MAIRSDAGERTVGAAHERVEGANARTQKGRQVLAEAETCLPARRCRLACPRGSLFTAPGK